MEVDYRSLILIYGQVDPKSNCHWITFFLYLETFIKAKKRSGEVNIYWLVLFFRHTEQDSQCGLQILAAVTCFKLAWFWDRKRSGPPENQLHILRKKTSFSSVENKSCYYLCSWGRLFSTSAYLNGNLLTRSNIKNDLDKKWTLCLLNFRHVNRHMVSWIKAKFLDSIL